jgi:hypothetical protein
MSIAARALFSCVAVAVLTVPAVGQQFLPVQAGPASYGPMTQPSVNGRPIVIYNPGPSNSAVMAAYAEPADAAQAGVQPAPAPGCNSCGTCGCGSCCPGLDVSEHRTGVFIDYLYLRAFGIDMAHAIQQNGVGSAGSNTQGPNTTPQGDVGTVAPQFDNAFRVGIDWDLSCCSGLRVAYTQYSDDSQNSITAPPGIGGTVASLVIHPGTVTAATTFSAVNADYEIDFRTADIDYTVLLRGCESSALNLDLGARYAHLQQNFEQDAFFIGAPGSMTTTTNIAFDGGGLRAGLDGTWRVGNGHLAFYGNGFLDMLFGQFDSHYRQFDNTTATQLALSHWNDHRVVPVLEYELGFKWTGCCNHLQLGLGYYTAFWFNTIATSEYVEAVQNANFNRVSQTIAFTGLVSHAEYRF